MSTNAGATESNSDAVVSSELATETLAIEPSSGDTLVQDLVDVDDARVSGSELGVVMDKDDSTDEVRVSGGELGIVIENSELVQELGDETRVSGDEVGIAIDNSELVQELDDEARVSGDEAGTVMDKGEKALDESRSDAVVSSLPPAATDEVKIGDGSLDSKTETLATEPSSGDIIVQDLVDDEVKIGDDLLESRTLIMETSIDGYIASRDDKRIITENIEKVSDENEVNIEEKEGEYKVTDIVWAKVKDYPWWPGQILDPSSSTDKAKKHSNKKGLLVGYFGDQSFAWNKPSNIKSFRKNFSKLAKQSNSKPFFHAVDCALDEVSRRVDFGLACSCLSKEVYDKIKSQEFVNAGITKEASKINGGDRFSTVSSFDPVQVVRSVQELAKEQFDGFDRLEILSVRTRLLAFFRWKGWEGCYQFQAENFLEDLSNKLEDESVVSLTEDNKVVEDEKPASVTKKVKFVKRKLDLSDSDDSEDSDDSGPRKKERSVEKMTQKGSSKVKRSKKEHSKKASVKDNGNEKPASGGKKVSSKKQKPDVSDSDDSEDSVPPKKEKRTTNVTTKGNSSVKRSKQSISKKATVEDSKNEGSVSGDSDDSEGSVPHKKERSVSSLTPKVDPSVKRTKQGISKKATVEDHGNEKPVSGGKKGLSKKSKRDVSDSDDSVPRKKEKKLTNKASSVKRSKKSTSKKAIAEDNGNGTSDKKSSNSSPKKLFRVGDRICRIAKQISESPSILKNESEKSKNDNDDDDEESS